MSTPRWFKPEVTLSGAVQIVLLIVAMSGAYFGVLGRIDGNDKDISALQHVVADIPGIKSDVLLLQNTIANRSQARDAQISGINGQVESVSGRLDKVETSVDNKLDEIAKSLASMQSDIAALKAMQTGSRDSRP